MGPVIIAYALLVLSILSEVTASSLLVKTESFTRFFPTLVVITLFSLAIYSLTHVIKVIPLGIAYAIWAGAGIILTALIGYFVLHQHLDLPAISGIFLIILGVIIINLFSKSAGH